MYIVNYDYVGVQNEGFDNLGDAKKAAKEWLYDDDHYMCVVEITKYRYTENPTSPLSDQRHVGKLWTLERSQSTDGKIYTDYLPKAYIYRNFKTWGHYIDVEIESRLKSKMKLDESLTKLIPSDDDDLVSYTVTSGVLKGTRFNGTSDILLRSDLDLFKGLEQSDFIDKDDHLYSLNQTAEMEHYKPRQTFNDLVYEEGSAMGLEIGSELALIDTPLASLILKHGFTLTKLHALAPRYGMFKDGELIGICSRRSLIPEERNQRNQYRKEKEFI